MLLMNIEDKIIVEFDPKTRVLHLSATEKLYCTAKNELNELCDYVRGIINENAGKDRIYMIVDLKKFNIDPKLADLYGEKISRIYQDYIYPGGLVRYGFGITRVAVKVGQAKHMDEDPHLFSTKEKAMVYIRSLINGNCKVTQN